MKERTLALAGVFQATELVRQAAQHGAWSGYAASTCLQSLLALDSESVSGVFGGVRDVHTGIETLIATLEGEQRNADSLRYAVGLMQLERRFRRERKLQQQIGIELERVAANGAELEAHEREDLQAGEIAELYRETISRLTPRIVVRGHPQFLQVERTVNWIRTLLFAGLRSAVLWRQLGGGRFELLLGRARVLREARHLLTG